jgi:DNA-binding NarL/FixJ family response regulator
MKNQTFELPHTLNGKNGKAHHRLSVRELEILELAANGYNNKQIADMLIMSIDIVDTYNHSVMDKLSARNMKQHAIAIALRNKPID